MKENYPENGKEAAEIIRCELDTLRAAYTADAGRTMLCFLVERNWQDKKFVDDINAAMDHVVKNGIPDRDR